MSSGDTLVIVAVNTKSLSWPLPAYRHTWHERGDYIAAGLAACTGGAVCFLGGAVCFNFGCARLLRGLSLSGELL